MKKVLLLFVFLFSFSWSDTISITNEGTSLPKIVLKDSSSLNDRDLKHNFYNILLNDLKVSSNFEVLSSGDEKGNYSFEYFLVKSGTKLDLRVIIRANGVQKSDKSYSITSLEEYPFLAHRAVKDSVRTLGLAPIEWMDHKILIARNSSNKKSQIIMADYTLTYQKVMVGGGLNLFPKWANKEQNAFYYTAYDHNVPTLYLYDLKTNKASRIISSTGMLVASDVSKDGSKLVLTMAPNDQPDIYVYDVKKKVLQRITDYSGIDVNGNFVEDEKKIVFVSDRLSYPNIFIQTIGSNNAEQLVFHGKNNSSVSTYKNYLVYSSREPEQRGVFNLYLMSTQSDYVRQLTANGKNIFPRFSNDGGSIVYIKYLGEQTALGVIRVNANKSFHFPLKVGRIQSIDW